MSIFTSPIFWTFASLIFIVLLIWVYIKLFKMYNSPDGERYRKMGMQGWFVPTKEDEKK